MRRTAPPRPSLTRQELEARHGRVWDTRQLAAEFIVTSIITPDTIVVKRKADGQIGSMMFQNDPRYYFAFMPSPGCE